MSATPTRYINVGPAMGEFCGMYLETRNALKRAADAILIPAIDGRNYGSRMNSEDFAVLKEFMQRLEEDFAFAGVLSRDETAPDETETTYFGEQRLVLSGEPA